MSSYVDYHKMTILTVGAQDWIPSCLGNNYLQVISVKFRSG